MILNKLKATFLAIALMVAACDSSDPVKEEQEIETTRDIAVTIDTKVDRKEISPFIYGSNQRLGSNDPWTVRRIGGNRLTGYNWENDYSNAGEDWMHSSDTYLLSNYGISGSSSDPARVMTTFHDESIRIGAETVITLQMAGYVSADGGGSVSENQAAPSNRWKEVKFRKDAAFDLNPDKSDDHVYMDEFINYMVNRYGDASSENGVRWYSLDNEPGLWSHTHPRIHAAPVGVVELVERSIELALAVKAVDPNAKIVGPALYGFGAYENLQGAPDWQSEKIGRWFIDYFLDKMRQAEQDYGKRLLDVLDVHWYPEAMGDNRIVFSDSPGTEKDILARLQAPRSLWDATYIENSWIGEWKSDFLPIIPNIQASIDQYYPGTQLGITEYNYGGANSISGGIAQADVLGIFGTNEIHLASLWKMQEANRFVSWAFDLYRNYDGQGSSFGNTSVQTNHEEAESFSVYASIHDQSDEQLHLMAINKNQNEATRFTFNLVSDTIYSEAKIWYFDSSGRGIQNAESKTVSGSSFTYDIPTNTVVHIVLN